ncbi:hypothetical protein EDB85DRAFT_532516 [Lactarius pseudohatsudake]|nr:hypothetical protein EDB85DRAFT_532516 [Lactarius pseudohatsudake]
MRGSGGGVVQCEPSDLRPRSRPRAGSWALHHERGAGRITGSRPCAHSRATVAHSFAPVHHLLLGPRRPLRPLAPNRLASSSSSAAAAAIEFAVCTTSAPPLRLGLSLWVVEGAMLTVMSELGESTASECPAHRLISIEHGDLRRNCKSNFKTKCRRVRTSRDEGTASSGRRQPATYGTGTSLGLRASWLPHGTRTRRTCRVRPQRLNFKYLQFVDLPDPENVYVYRTRANALPAFLQNVRSLPHLFLYSHPVFVLHRKYATTSGTASASSPSASSSRS